VDVSDRRFNGLHGPEVPIITSAFLPESKTSGSGPLQDSQPFQQQRALDVFHEPLDTPGKRGLQSLQEQIDAAVTGLGLNADVDVFRHEDIRGLPARLTVDGILKTFRQQMPPVVVRQEWNPPIARLGQLVAVARLVKSLDGLSMAAHGSRV
jgi:hypothetical protein